MSGYELDEVLDLVNEEQKQLRRLVGVVADSKAVRALLEQYVLRAWQRGAKAEVRPLPAGVGSSRPPSQAVTPIESPRPAIEVNVTTRPVDLEAARRERRRRERGEP